MKKYVFLQSEFKKCYLLQKDKYYNSNFKPKSVIRIWVY